MQGNPFLSTAPELFLVQRAKRIRWIFSTLLTILGPASWKLQCSYSSFCQTEGRCLLTGTHMPWESGEQGVLCIDRWRDRKGSGLWPGHLGMNVETDLQGNEWCLPCVDGTSWSLFCCSRSILWEWKREYLRSSLWGWRKWENLTKTWRHETGTCLRFSSWTVLSSVSSE